MRRLRWIFAGLLLILLVAYIGGAWYFSDLVISFTPPTERSDDWLAKWAPEWEITPTERVTVSSGEIILAGDYYDNPSETECAVIVMHGRTGDRRVVGYFGPIFWELGCDVLAYDARGHGDSSPAYLTYGYYDKGDLNAVVDWLAERTGFDVGQIGILGQSYGAATALQMLPEEPDVAFVIADSSYQDMVTIISHQANEQFAGWVNLFIPTAFQIAEMRANFESDDVSPLLAVAQVDTPILLIHSLQDDFTPSSHSEALYAAANPDTTELFLTDWGASHAASVSTNPEEFSAEIYRFINEYAPDFANIDAEAASDS